jgi:hypothetical protein
MFSSFRNWITGRTRLGGRRPATGKPCKAILQVESLEQRLVLSTTDMTTMAQWFGPPKTTPTTLYLNFDGGTLNWNMMGYQGSKTIQSYVPTPGSTRDQDIQSILSEVGQIFAPFNVQVKQMKGANNYDQSNGNTTVFVGGDATNVSDGLKAEHSSTPGEFKDVPGITLGYLHARDSEPYHLAFVDPMVQGVKGEPWWNNDSTDQIAESIGHEAGHTFGLEHVLTGDATDLMSYSALNKTFLNRTFSVTDQNYDPSSDITNGGGSMYAIAFHPSWGNAWGLDFYAKATQQNSYTYLLAVLGANPHQMTGQVADIHTFLNWKFKGTVATFSDANAAHTADSYTATIHWGNGHTSTGTVHSNHDGTYRVTGTNTYHAIPEFDSYPVGVTITDANGYTLYLTGWANVTRAANDLTGYGYANSATAGQGRNFAIATFSDPDGSGQAADYKVVIHWGDGSVTAGNVTLNQDGTFLVSGWNNYTTPGTYTVTIDITDAGGTLEVTSTVYIPTVTLKPWNPKSNKHEV